MNFRFLILLLCIVSTPFAAVSQDVGDFRSSDEYVRGLIMDIDNGSRGYLLDWIEKLNQESAPIGSQLEIDTTAKDLGSYKLDELRKLLYDYYGIEKPITAGNITEADYFTVHNADYITYKNIEYESTNTGSLLVLQGNVLLEIYDEENGTSYRIAADSVVINQLLRSVSARDNITYSQRGPGETDFTDIFSCSAFILHIDNWNGVVLLPETERTVTNENGQEFVYSLSGADAYQGSTGILLVKGGIIGTAAENPLLSIRTTQLSLLSEGDWFAENGILYIGRVPILYLPIFFNPGRVLSFNPAFGFTNDRGMFFNSTIPLFGKLPENNNGRQSAFSQYLNQYSGLMDNQIESTANDNSENTNGLLSGNQELNNWAEESDSYAAVILDAYEDKGLAVGITGELKELGKIESADLLAVLACDPTISGETETSNLRLMINNSIRYTDNGLDMYLSLPFYSDSDVSLDYTGRKSFFSFDDLTGYASFPSTGSDIDIFTWEFSGNYSVDTSLITPFVNALVFHDVEIRTDIEVKQPWTYEFSSVSPLSFNIDIAGKILDWQVHDEGGGTGQDIPSETYSVSAPDYTYRPVESLTELMVKFPEISSAQEGLNGNETELHEYLADLPDATAEARHIVLDNDDLPGASRAVYESIAMDLSYSLSEKGHSSISFSEGWAKYSTVINNVTSKIVLSGSFLDKSISIKNTLLPSMYYQQHSKIDDEVVNWDTLELQAKENSTFSIQNQTSVHVPFLGLTYALNSRLLEYSYDNELSVYDFTPISWNSQTISRHTLQATWNITELHTKMKLTAVLPPGDFEVNPRISFAGRSFSADLSTKYVVDDSDIYSFEPLNISLSLLKGTIPVYGTISAALPLAGSVADAFSESQLRSEISIPLTDSMVISHRMIFDFTEYGLDTMVTTVRTSAFTAALQQGLDSGGDGATNEMIPEKLEIDGSIEFASYSFWKNRIKLKAMLSGSVFYNFREPEDNILSASFLLNVKIAEFLDLEITSTSRNTALDSYLSGSVNVFEDLLKSFNFFNIDDRYESKFNLQDISISAVHEMSDWDFVIDYTGGISLNTNINSYEWQSEASMYIRWKAFPEIDLSASIEHDGNGGNSVSVE